MHIILLLSRVAGSFCIQYKSTVSTFLFAETEVNIFLTAKYYQKTMRLHYKTSEDILISYVTTKTEQYAEKEGCFEQKKPSLQFQIN